jgi:phage baseplate assembly protein W
MAYKVVSINEINNSISNNALGVSFPFRGSHGIFTSTYTTVDQATSNLKNLLLTAKGERLMHPSFGTDLLRILFQPIDDSIKQLIDDIITQSVNEWLPYIQINDIEITTAVDDPELQYNVKIVVLFSVRGILNEQDNNTITIFSTDNQIILS